MSDTDSSTLSHISKLSCDLLDRIFKLNAVEEYIWYSDNFIILGAAGRLMSPLDTARATSQVCQTWRCIMLNSPALWGHLANTIYFLQKTTHWWDEVLLRTREAPIHFTCNGENNTRPMMHIYPVVYYEPITYPLVEKYVLPILNSSYRGRLTSVYLNVNLGESQLEDSRWRALRALGPNTQHLHLKLSRLPDCFFPDTPYRLLFPRLRTANMRTLALHSGFFAADLLGTLKEMRNLRHLELGTIGRLDGPAPLPFFASISLPYLEKIVFSDALFTPIWLLPQIYAAQHCKLLLRATCATRHTLSSLSLRAADIQLFSDALARYTRNYLDSSKNQDQTLRFVIQSKSIFYDISEPKDYSSSKVVIADQRPREPSSDVISPSSPFRIRIKSGTGQRLPRWLSKALIDAMFTLHGPAPVSVTGLQIDCRCPDADVLAPFGDKILAFLTSLTALERLALDPGLLCLIMTRIVPRPGSSTSTVRPFPALRSLTYYLASLGWPSGKESAHILNAFLAWRRSSGVPITQLTLHAYQFEDWALTAAGIRTRYPEIDEFRVDNDLANDLWQVAEGDRT